MSGLYVEFPYVQSSPNVGGLTPTGGGTPGVNPPSIPITGTDAAGNIIDSPCLQGDSGFRNVLTPASGNTNLGQGAAVFGNMNSNSLAGSGSIVSGNGNTNTGNSDIVEGLNNTVNANNGITTGNGNQVLNATGSSDNDNVSGSGNIITDSNNSDITGTSNTVNTTNNARIAGNTNNITNAVNSEVSGFNNTVVNSQSSRISGQSNTVRGNYADVTGRNNVVAVGVTEMSVEGNGNNQTAGGTGHLEGFTNTDDGYYNHIEGSGNVVSGTCNVTHVEGNQNVVTACNRTHVEGEQNTVNGAVSHTQGLLNTTTGRLGDNSGEGNTAKFNQHVAGRFAVVDPVVSTIVPVAGQLVEIVGWGVDSANRKNIRTLDDQGHQFVSGNRKGLGDLVYQNTNLNQAYFSGHRLFEWNYQHASDPYANLTINGTVEQTIIDYTTPGRNTLTPRLQAAFLRSGFGGFKLDLRCGFNLASAASTLTLRLYAKDSVGTVVLVSSKVVNFATIIGLGLAQPLCGEFKFWFDPISLVTPGTSLRLRSHVRAGLSLISSGDTGMFFTESEVYSNVDASKYNDLKLTAQWSVAGQDFYADGVSIYV